MSAQRPDAAAKRDAFFELHRGGCFVIPNPWDAGSARYLQSLGFKALATTSSGFVWSKGRPDGQVVHADPLRLHHTPPMGRQEKAFLILFESPSRTPR